MKGKISESPNPQDSLSIKGGLIIIGYLLGWLAVWFWWNWFYTWIWALEKYNAWDFPWSLPPSVFTESLVGNWIMYIILPVGLWLLLKHFLPKDNAKGRTKDISNQGKTAYNPLMVSETLVLILVFLTDIILFILAKYFQFQPESAAGKFALAVAWVIQGIFPIQFLLLCVYLNDKNKLWIRKRI